MVKRPLLTFADFLLEVGFSGLSRNSQVEVVQVIIPNTSDTLRSYSKPWNPQYHPTSPGYG